MNIKKEREKIGLKQKELAALLDVTSAFLGQVELGRKKATKKFEKFFDFVKKNKELELAVEGIQVIDRYFPSTFGLRTKTGIKSLLEVKVIITHHLQERIKGIKDGKWLKDNLEVDNNTLKNLAIFAHENIPGENIFNENLNFFMIKEQKNCCCCLHVLTTGDWRLEYSACDGCLFRITGSLQKLLLLYLAFRINPSHLELDRQISVSIDNKEFKYYHIQLFNIELNLIFDLIKNFIKTKQLDIPLVVVGNC